MSEIKKAPGVDSQAQSESVSIVSENTENVNIRPISEIREEIARLELLTSQSNNGENYRLYARLWALKWVLGEPS